MENPTFQIRYNFVTASVHPLTYVYLTHCPTKSDYSLFPKCILHFPASTPSPLSFSLSRRLFLHLCLGGLHPFLRTQLRCLIFTKPSTIVSNGWSPLSSLNSHKLYLHHCGVIYYALLYVTGIFVAICVLLSYCPPHARGHLIHKRPWKEHWPGGSRDLNLVPARLLISPVTLDR